MKYLSIFISLILCGCVTFPPSFEGSHYADGEITHKTSKVIFPGLLGGFNRKTDAINEYSADGKNYSVRYEQPKYYDGLAQHITIYVYQSEDTVERLESAALNEIKSNREKDKLIISDITNKAYLYSNKKNNLTGRKVTFNSQTMNWDNLVLASVLKKYDTYEHLYLFKGHNWVVKIRATGLKNEADKLNGKFESFVRAFFDQQKIEI